MAASYRIEGMRELMRTIRTLERLPQKVVTKAARKGMNVALLAARRRAPVDTGMLKKGLKLSGEKARTKGKKVYQVTFDKGMNDVFAKVSQAGKRSYYPASQEFGWTTNGKYTPGYNYLKKSMDSNTQKIETTIVRVMTDEIDKL